MTYFFTPTAAPQNNRLALLHRVSPLALMLAVVGYQPAMAQEAVVVANGETVTDTVILDEEGDSLLIEDGGAIATVGDVDGVLSNANDIVVTNDGTITTQGTNAEGIETTGDNVAITNNGTIRTFGFVGTGILSSGDNVTITNNGTITSEFDAIKLTGTNAKVTNNGVLISDDFSSDGIEVSGTHAVAINSASGEILTRFSTSSGIEASGQFAMALNDGDIRTEERDSDGITLSGDESVAINNSLITTLGNNSDGVAGRGVLHRISNTGMITTQGTTAHGIRSLGSGATVANSGVIMTAGDSSSGIALRSNDQSATNTGSVATSGGGAAGIEGGGRNAAIFNSGSVVTTGTEAHAIWLVGENAQFTNTGHLSATGANSLAISGESGDDTVTLGAGSRIIGGVDLGDGDDTVNVQSGGPSAVLTMQNVETINLADGVAAFVDETGATAVVQTIDMTGFAASTDATGALTTDAHRVVQAETGVSGAWASLFGSARARGADGLALAHEHDFAGLMAGYETVLGDTRFGLVGGVSQSNITTDISSTEIDTETAFGGFYLGAALGGAEITASLLAGAERHDSDRLIADNLVGIETATARYDSRFVSAGLEVAAGAFSFAGVQVQPSAMLNYTRSRIDGYTETGTTNANLTVDDRTAQTLYARGQLETLSSIGATEIAYRAGIDARFSDADDVTISIGDANQSFAPSDGDAVLGGFLGARATFAQSDTMRLTGDIEYGFAEGDEDRLAAGLNVSFSF